MTIGYDPVSCQVWLDPLGSGPPPAQMLCLDHAERLQPPRGWVVVDRRSAQTVIVAPSNAPRRPTVGRAPRRVARRWGQIDEPRLEFTVDPEVQQLDPLSESALPEPETQQLEPEPGIVEEPEPGIVEEPEPGIVEEPEPGIVEEPEPGPVELPEPGPIDLPEVVPAAVAAERTDDLEALMKPRGRLLSRAFEAGKPHRNLLLDPEE